MGGRFAARLLTVASLIVVVGAGAAGAQSRFFGDTRSRGFISRTVVVPQGVVLSSGFSPAYRYGGRYSGFSLGFCRGCGGYGSLCNCGGPFILPPIAIDAGELYGPRALLRFYGVGDTRIAPPAPRAVATPPAGLLPAAGQPPIRLANAGARGRAWKFIDYGDRLIKQGRYREALSRYKKAISSSAELAAARFRAGLAYLALGNFDRAALEIRRGLRLDPDWPQSDFVLEDLFPKDDELRGLFRSLAVRLGETPNDAEARLLAGVLLHFDGQGAAATQQFRRVIQITGDDEAARAFLPKPPAEEVADNAAP